MFLSLATLHPLSDNPATESTFVLNAIVQRLLPAPIAGTGLDIDRHSLLERSRRRAARQREALLAQMRERIVR